MSVFADSPNVTSGGLLHLGHNPLLERLYLFSLPAGWLTDAVLGSLHNRSCSQLRYLTLGSHDSPPETEFSAEAVIGSVTQGRAVHSSAGGNSRANHQGKGEIRYPTSSVSTLIGKLGYTWHRLRF